MKKMRLLLVIPLLFLISCQEQYEHNTSNVQINSVSHMFYSTFEDAVLNSATDIVIVNYLGSRMFDDVWKEFEFAVVENILGETTDYIRVYVDLSTEMHILGHEGHDHHHREALHFQQNVDYLLPLINTNSPTSRFYNVDGIDNFLFIRGIAVNLNNLIESVMYGENLNEHIDGVNLLARDAHNQIIELVEELAVEIEENTTWERIFIRSYEMDDIILGSPDVLIVEITEPRRLHDAFYGQVLRTDIFFVDVVEVLYGSDEFVGNTSITFFANTVSIGERYIVAVQQSAENNRWAFRFTSRNSLFSMDQLDGILYILEQREPEITAEPPVMEVDDEKYEIVEEIEELTFQEALSYATDLAIVEFISCELFTENITRFDFEVVEFIDGEMFDEIIVYMDVGNEKHCNDMFESNNQYLLPLIHVVDNEFVFIRSIIINLYAPGRSVMNHTLLNHKFPDIREEVIWYIVELMNK